MNEMKKPIKEKTIADPKSLHCLVFYDLMTMIPVTCEQLSVHIVMPCENDEPAGFLKR